MLKTLIWLGRKLIPPQIKNKIFVYRSNKRSNKSMLERHTIIEKWKATGKQLPTPHEIKQVIIENYQRASGYKTLIETGTYMGDMVAAQKNNFDTIYSIELSKQFWQRASIRFKKYPHIKIVYGDSGKVLYHLTKDLTTPAIFWLDGHYSAGHTAKGEKECPILEEIDAITKNAAFKHILLIDDARLFTGNNDYPTLNYLTNYLKSKHSGYEIAVKDDVIVCT